MYTILLGLLVLQHLLQQLNKNISPNLKEDKRDKQYKAHREKQTNITIITATTTTAMKENKKSP